MKNKKQKTSYVSISSNVYKTGASYRVRMTVNGERYSRNFSNKRKAIKYRNELRRSIV